MKILIGQNIDHGKQQIQDVLTIVPETEFEKQYLDNTFPMRKEGDEWKVNTGINSSLCIMGYKTTIGRGNIL